MSVSRSLGPHLPDSLLARLVAPEPADRLGQAIVLVTVDPYGRPHPALVSYAELLALDPARVRLALHAGTRSATHLRETGRATLVFADAELALYVKADAVPLPVAPGHGDLARFELHVCDVLEDRAEGEEAGAGLLGGITFSWPGGPEAWARHRARLREALQA
ncbi:MAG: pyridoxamine 5'-phosphate oxidase family protein [Candidatus Rokubacteria bacterium]|nr:pyridoxamine 5'-phosphate oxidase family protein [Candidatus Rokubacteria bacterium]